MSLVINNNIMAANTARNLNAHYNRLAISTQRLSSGLRINGAADDAAGLAIRELQRSDIAALHQGVRNANDAISMLQVADGALGIIDEKLIRMKELAEQAATGTYDSTQRLMIESEYQAMASEITRIANATDFNGIKLLDGSLSGAHDGSELEAKGAMKIHFGTANSSAEDYYYVNIGDCTAAALGLGNSIPAEYQLRDPVTGTVTTVTKLDKPVFMDGTDPATVNEGMMVAVQKVIRGTGPLDIAHLVKTNKGWINIATGNVAQYHPNNPITPATDNKGNLLFVDESQHVDGQAMRTYWQASYQTENGDYLTANQVKTLEARTLPGATVSSQAAAQRTLVAINEAIVSKDKIRAHLGALQNRLENTVSNLTIQSENLQASESRISDIDVATEMTNFVRNQILTQSAVAMLSQANSLPQMAMQLVGG